MASLCF